MTTSRIIRTLLAPLAATAGLAAAPLAASAAPPAPDLVTTIVDPGPVLAGTSARYDVRVTNIGNKNTVAPTTLTIQLPRTNTSPTVRVLGTVSNITGSGCVLSGTSITCPLSVPRNGGTRIVSFDMVLPVSTAPIGFRAEATTTGERNPADNVATLTANQTFHTVSNAAPANLTISHCTGRNLTSFYECEITPTSISSHVATLVPGGTVDLSGTAPMRTVWAATGRSAARSSR